jgi:hypothetical protein
MNDMTPLIDRMPAWMQREYWYTRPQNGCVDWPSIEAFHRDVYEHNRWWRRFLRWVIW